jgi:hypothetical protein
LANNEDTLNRARAQIEEMGESLGIKVPENMSENMERLHEVLLGDDKASLKRAERAKFLAADGQAYLSELMESEEAKQLEQEGTKAFEELRQMEEAQRIKRALSEVLASTLGTESGEDFSLETVKEAVMNVATPGALSAGIRDATKRLAKANLEEAVKETIENDKSGILQQISKAREQSGSSGGGDIGGDSGGCSDLADADTDAETGALADAKTRADTVLQKLGHGGLEGAAETAKDATLRASKALAQDIDKDAVADGADKTIEQSAEYLQRARATREGHHILNHSLTYLKEGMKQGLVQDVVRNFGSAEMVDLGKRAIADEDARAQFLEKVRLAGVDFLSKSLPSVQIPPISGYRENVAYTIDGLDLSGFNIGPDAIQIQSYDLSSAEWNGEVLQLTCSGVSATVDGLSWSYRQEYFPYLAGQGEADCTIDGLQINLGFKLVRRKTEASGAASVSAPGSSGADAASDSSSSASGVNAASDSSSSTSSTGASSSTGEVELPVHLVLASNELLVEKLELNTRGATIAWVYNMLLALFSEVVRDYIVSNVVNSLEDATDEWLGKLNDTGESIGLPVILQNLLRMPIENLEIVGPKARREEALVLIDSSSSSAQTYDVEFLEPGPLGMRIGASAANESARVADESAKGTKSVVIKFFKNADGSESLAERAGKIKLGDIPVGLNGKSLEGMPTSVIIAAIREANSTRPLRMTFRRDADESAQGKQAVIEQVFGPGPLGLELTANTNIAGTLK